MNLNAAAPATASRSGSSAPVLWPRGSVARGVEAMRRATRLPVTVKCRIGVDDRDSYEDLKGFATTVAAAGCETFIGTPVGVLHG